MIKRLLPRTLRARLTALIILSTLAVLALSGFALYEALRSRIESTSTEQMYGTLSALEVHLSEIQSTDEIGRNTGMWIDQLHGHRNLDLAIFDMSGKRLFATPGFRSYAPINSNQTSVLASSKFARSKFRYLISTVPLKKAIGSSVRVVIQYDESSDQAFLRVHAYTIFVIEVFGVMLAAASAYGIAMLGLSPLRRLVARAEEMSTTRLAQPLPELDASGELKELGHAFNGMLARLDESFTRLGQFSSNLAHDMRTPLTNLLAAAQVALSQPRSAAEYQEVIESSIDEYRRLSRMIEDMLFLARSEQAGASLSIRELDAVVEAERVAGYYEPMADDAEIAIEVKGHGVVQADLLLYQRLLSNLLSNALAYAPKGSTIAIECTQQADSTTITVSDTGLGIEDPHLDRLFERFYRVDPSRRDSASGTGLGLAIVRSIMDSHGGQCGVESEPDVRTAFWLRFPRREP
ncbi:heavy metal sensor histidine kinase [Paraburkholderia nemoris]|uniref:heavy metal sensor histidine kinase n=1 Tax=Paraburkholderia nemoris TaxID=2793076 RepID=UPI0038B977F1